MHTRTEVYEHTQASRIISKFLYKRTDAHRHTHAHTLYWPWDPLSSLESTPVSI